eukprot:scaffold173_cov221-Pinguiococcus_pyrenoidosus.AAC.4
MPRDHLIQGPAKLQGSATPAFHGGLLAAGRGEHRDSQTGRGGTWEAIQVVRNNQRTLCAHSAKSSFQLRYQDYAQGCPLSAILGYWRVTAEKRLGHSSDEAFA